ncbi:FecR domain-containing protein [Pedobacter sp. FW305-3-2-15-E-R2A2]|uniref:FecR domain-containing protein n=1 Tax=Pedobacter sp. FW305-3-2-15-E-R2A2 TaxID=3140251 RepID=UPI003140B623
MTTKSISELLTRYYNNECTPEEEARVNEWFAEHGSATTSFEQMDAEAQQVWVNALFTDITAANALKTPTPKVLKKRLWPRIAAAAAVLIGIGIGLYVVSHESEQGRVISYANTIHPAKNAATLKLADGKVISLNESKTGIVIDIAALTYDDGTAVVLNSAAEKQLQSEADEKAGNLTVSTPTGRQYQLILPDGSKVWLNASSALTFPTIFSAKGNRMITLIGEAYFEVAKDKSRPFIVKTNTQEVKVLGTHFNINSNHSTVRTTLLEGSIAVSPLGYVNDQEGLALSSAAVLLKPGEQAVQKSGKIEVISVDTEQAVSWKDGWFYFKSASLSEVLNEAAKWYDLKITYKSDVPADRFTGKVPRTASLGMFIKVLQLSDVKFKLEGRNMIID